MKNKPISMRSLGQSHNPESYERARKAWISPTPLHVVLSCYFISYQLTQINSDDFHSKSIYV